MNEVTSHATGDDLIKLGLFIFSGSQRGEGKSFPRPGSSLATDNRSVASTLEETLLGFSSP